MNRGGNAGLSGQARGGGRFAGGGRRDGGFDGQRHFRHRGNGFAYGFGYDAYGAAPYGYYDDSYSYDDEPVYEVAPQSGADQYCRQRFQSYDPASGTYLGYDGERHPCP
jgi:hypothetical protein